MNDPIGPYEFSLWGEEHWGSILEYLLTYFQQSNDQFHVPATESYADGLQS